MPLKKWFPDVRMPGNRVSPDEMDYIYEYSVIYPSISETFYGTVEATSTSAIVFDNVKADYPRNAVLVILGVAGGMGGTATFNGKDQFGRSISESIGFASAAGGGTKSGTKVFSEITSGSVTVAGLGGTAVGTTKLGVSKGTAANNVAIFGLPVRIGSTADVRSITWIDNGTQRALNGGTIGAYVGTAAHSFRGTAIVAATDIYRVRVKSTYSAEENYVV